MTTPRRLAIAALAALTLVAAPAAAAKDIRNARVCGAHGCRDSGPLGLAGFALMPPGTGTPPLAPWYRITLAMGDGHHILQRYKVLWAPRIHMIAIDEPGPHWLNASRKAERLARRITRGVTPYPAATMPLHLPPPGKAEVIGPFTHRREDPGGGLPWLVLPIVGAVALAAALLYRSRRAKAHTAAAPTTPT